MAQKRGSQAAPYVASYLRAQDDASWEEKLVEVESLKFADFEPIMASATLEKIQSWKMFDFGLEVCELDNELFFVKEKNWIDIQFHGPILSTIRWSEWCNVC